jgi:predicted CoA-binding protein
MSDSSRSQPVVAGASNKLVGIKPTDDEIKALLVGAKNIAIVGASDDQARPVYGVSQWLLDKTEYNLFFVNPRLKILFGHEVYATVMDIPEWVDIVVVFRKSADVPKVLEEALAARAKALWLQLGITNDASAMKANKSGLHVVQDRCIKIEYERLLLL